MPDPDYADNPAGCLLVVIGLFLLFLLALVLQSCL